MTFESYARRLTKHFMQALKRQSTASHGNLTLGTIDLTPKTPRLSWLGGKMHKQAKGRRSGNSGHLPEHILANTDNANPYQGPDGKWYFIEEGNHPCEVAYETRAAANIALLDYRKWLNTPKEIQA